MSADVVAALRTLADDHELLRNVARRAIEDELVDWRDNRRFMLRNNGFVIRESDWLEDEARNEQYSLAEFGHRTARPEALAAARAYLGEPS